MAFWAFLTFFQQVNRSTLGVSNYCLRAERLSIIDAQAPFAKL
jgi:hypothetical protein